jgi:hypothetical protein
VGVLAPSGSFGILTKIPGYANRENDLSIALVAKMDLTSSTISRIKLIWLPMCPSG